MLEGAAGDGHLDALLDQAVEAVNSGRLDEAQRLAQQVLAIDVDNDDVDDLLAGAPDGGGILRRPTIMFCDLVGSTALSARHDPEVYRRIVGRYKETCREILERTYGGRIMNIKGDGLLALFGYPTAREDDAGRAVCAGLELLDAIRALSARAEREVGEPLAARVGVHRGLAYIDAREGDVYGLAVNVAARLHELAAPGSVVASEPVVRLLADQFELRAQSPEKVKGIDEPLTAWRVIGERDGSAAPSGGTLPVGREEELEELWRAWMDDAGATVVTGEAGIGKSSLVNAHASAVASTGATVVRMFGSSVHGAGLYPFRTLLERRCEITRDATSAERLALLRQHLAELPLDAAAALPALAAVLRIDGATGHQGTSSEGRKLHDELIAATAEYVRASVTTPPALLIAEDAHWFDEMTLEALATVVRSRPAGLRVVVTSRQERVPGIAARTITVEPLSDDDSRTLVERLDPDDVTGSFRGELLARGAGVPLYLEELVRAAVEAAHSDIDGGDVITGGPQPDRTGIPEVLYQPLVARLDAIAGSAEVVAAAAAFGERFELELLAEVVGSSLDELRPVLQALVEGRVVEALPGPGEQYRFRHELIRQAADELQPTSARQRTHGRVADVVRAAAVDETLVDWLTIANHYELARRPVDALDCYQRSADDARSLGALSATQERLGQAIKLVVALGDGEARTAREIELRLARAFVAVSVEGNASPSALEDYERCLELALTVSSEEVLLTLVPLWSYYASRADLARAGEVIEVLRTVVQDGRDWFGVENQAGFGMLDWFGGRFIDAQRRLEQAAIGRTARGADARVTARWFLPNDPTASISTHLGLARFVRGQAAAAETAFSAGEAIAARLPFPQGPYSTAYNRTYRSWALMHLGAFDAAADAAESALTLANQHGFDFWVMAATTQQLVIDVHRAWRGDGEHPDQAALAGVAAQLDGLIAMWELIEVRLLLPAILAAAALARAGLGDLDAARGRLDEAVALSNGRGARFYDAELGRVRALLELDHKVRVRVLEQAFAVAAEQGAIAFQLRIAHDLHRADPTRGGPCVDEVLAGLPAAESYPELQQVRQLVQTDVSIG